MSEPSKLHSLRQTLGAARQNVHAEALESLQNELDALGVQHPYELGGDHVDRLMLNEFFKQGGRGLPVDLSGTEYLYRICSVRKFVEYGGWPVADRHRNDADLWLTLKRAFDDAPDWMPLKRYASGALTGPRGFTWWTSLDLLATNTLCEAHAIGLPNDWLAKYAVVLRCRLAEFGEENVVFVPTVLDAFDGEIFHPTVSEANPRAGLTINLERPDAVDDGTDEFVLLNVDVGAIDFIPVLIDRRLRAQHPVRLNSGLRTLLETYYRHLGE